MKAMTLATAAFALLLVLGCGFSGPPAGGAIGNTPEATPTATNTPEPTPGPEQAVLQAYIRYWQVYADALLNLDNSRLADVMTGPRLERALEEIQDLQARNRAVRIVVRNQPVVLEITDQKAVLQDDYENQSHFVDRETKVALRELGAPQTFKTFVTLIKVGSTWKVLESVRETGEP